MIQHYRERSQNKATECATKKAPTWITEVFLVPGYGGGIGDFRSVLSTSTPADCFRQGCLSVHDPALQFISPVLALTVCSAPNRPARPAATFGHRALMTVVSCFLGQALVPVVGSRPAHRSTAMKKNGGHARGAHARDPHT